MARIGAGSRRIGGAEHPITDRWTFRRPRLASIAAVLALVTALLVAVGGRAPARAASPAAGYATWTEARPATGPSGRTDAAGAYDAATGQLVLFGGVNAAGTYLDDTWTWNGTTWTQLHPATAPSARAGASLAFDAATGQLVLFGGVSDGVDVGDTWTWDGTTWTRQQPDDSPTPRAWASTAFDAATGQLVLFGGQQGATYLGDTWTWNGTTWAHPAAPGLTSPVAGAAMAFDPTTGQVILYGGYSSNGPDGGYGEATFAWTGSAWLEYGTAGRPPAVAFASMVFDQATGQLLLVGGQSSTGASNQVWALTDSDGTWTQQHGTTPTARGDAAMAFDQATGQLVLFGGLAGASVLGDTWTDAFPASAPDWSRLSPAGSPPARSGASMAYDQATGQLLLFGGIDTSGSILDDTWSFNGVTWRHIQAAVAPPARMYGAMAYDPATGQVVLFGGENATSFDGSTWVWNGTTWTDATPPGGPTARTGASMAYDQATGQLLLFGGETAGQTLPPPGDTWSWNGTTWTELHPATSPPGRKRATLAYDAATGQLVLFGGYIDGQGGGDQDDTWTWDGTTWAKADPATTPPARIDASMAFDPATGQLVLYGGLNDDRQDLDRTWSWNGTDWDEQATSTSPGLVDAGSLGFDPLTGQLVFVIIDPNGTDPQTWIYGVHGPTATATALASAPDPSVAGDQVTYTATVNPVPPAGTVGFTDGGGPIDGCSAAPVDTTRGTAGYGQATCTVTYDAIGRHTVVADYAGFAGYQASTSTAITQTVTDDPHYAYPHGGADAPLTCPRTTNTADQCTLAEALGLATAGGTVYLAVSGDQSDASSWYVGNFSLAVTGTSATRTVTIEPAAAVQDPILDGNSGSATGCPTGTCDGPVFAIAPGVWATLSGVTIQHGNNASSGAGGGIRVGNGAHLKVADSTFTDNTAGSGGAIADAALGDTGTLDVADSTFTGNTAGTGGAIANEAQPEFGGPSGGHGTLTVSGSTFYRNSAPGSGGAIDNADSAVNTGVGTATITDSTFVANTSSYGSAISNGAGYGQAVLTVTGSTFSGNIGTNEGTIGDLASDSGGAITLGADVFDGTCVIQNGNFVDLGYNVGSDSSCYRGGTGDVDGGATVTDRLAHLADNGGSTRTMSLLVGNPAISLIPASTTVSGHRLCPTVDQRGVASTSGAACDAGAVQLSQPPSSSTDVSVSPALGGVNLTATVTGAPSYPTPEGTVDFTRGDTTLCSSSPVSGGTASCFVPGVLSGPVTFTAGYTSSNGYASSGGSATINALPTLYVATGGTDAGNDTCSQAKPCATIPYADLLAAGTATIHVGPGTFDQAVTLADKDITIIGDSGGTTLTAPAGYTAVTLDSGSLTLRGVTISGASMGLDQEGGTLTVTDSTIADNREDGIAQDAGTLTVRNSTIADNGQKGIAGFGGTAAVVSSTVVNDGEGLAVDSGATVTVTASILAKNTSGDCAGAPADGGYNVDDDATCPFTAPSVGDSVDIDGYLSALGSNGGPTRTVALQYASADPAAGPDPAVGLVPADADIPGTGTAICSEPDQRGTVRTTPCAAGAYELHATTTTLSSSVNPSTPDQPVTITATVRPQPDAGAVTFDVDGTQVCLRPMTTGQATCTLSALTDGSHTVTVAYTGDPNYAASTGGLTQQVRPTTTISGSVTSDAGGDPLAGVAVTVYAAGDGAAAGSGTTTANGGYTVTGIPAGHYLLCFAADHATGGPSASGYVSACGVTVTVTASPATVDRALASARALIACGPTPFVDIATSPFCGAITWLVDRHITNGVDPTHFDPAGTVTRGQMALFLYRLATGTATAPACTTPPFDDVPVTMTACGAITWLVGHHITNGVDPTHFDPAGTVTRAQMAAFLHRLSDDTEIRGTVTAGGSSPVPDTVVVITGTGETDESYSTVTDRAGRYAVEDVTAGSYTVCFDPPSGSGYAYQCYDARIGGAPPDVVTARAFTPATANATLAPPRP